MKKKLIGYICALSAVMILIISVTAGCGVLTGGGSGKAEPPEIAGLTFSDRMDLEYAEGFDIFRYNDGYALIDIHGSQKYLVIPEGKPVPEKLDSRIIVLKRPFDNIYLAASSAMSLFDAMGALDQIRYTGTRKEDWYIENTVAALESGEMIFAGKYSQPDFETLVKGGCRLCIESTMINHTPEVKEKLEELGLPVFIEQSSYEPHPLGRVEWIKLYGFIAEKEDKAEEFFSSQTAILKSLEDFENTEKTVAFFYINSSGSAVVRKSEDYISRMIELAGGRYIFRGLKNNQSKSSSVKMSMEEFYNTAVNADYLIYNASIDNSLSDINALIDKNELFKDFKAVKSGNVWTTDKYLYQATDITAELINDINKMLTGGGNDDMVFLNKVS